MKIVHIITAFGIGGAEKLLLDIVNRQVNEHEVHLVYLKPITDLLHLVDNRVSVKHIPISFTTVRNLRRYFKEYTPDIVHTHLGHADFFGIYTCRKLNVKTFSTVHSTNFQKSFIDKVYFNLYKLLARISEKTIFIAISSSVKHMILKEFKIRKNRVILLYNAIEKRILSEKNSLSYDEFKLLFVGRLTKAKSIDTLLKAISYSHIDDIKLTIVGDGILRKDLEQLSKELQIEHQVDFVGKQQQIDSFYAEADAFVLPSLWEGFGIVILEAFRAKLPVVASNIEGPAELIKHQENGLLFEVTNPADLAEKIMMLKENPELRTNLANNGFKTFTDIFEIENYVKKLNFLYQYGALPN